MFNYKASNVPFNSANLPHDLLPNLFAAGFKPVQYDGEDGVFLVKSVDFKTPPQRVSELSADLPVTTLFFELSEEGILHVLNESGEFETLYNSNADFWSLLQDAGVLMPGTKQLSA